MNKKPTQKPCTPARSAGGFAIHFSQNTSQNCKRVCLANAQKEIKIVANLKKKYMEMKISQPLTKAIRNLGNMLILKIIEINKLSSKLKINCFKISNYV